MGKRKNHIDEQFRKHLRQYETSPPEEIWSGISSALGQKRRKQRIVVYWRMAASIAVLFGLGTMFYFLRQEPVNPLAEQEQSADTIQQSSLPEIIQPPMVEKIAESPETVTGEPGREAVLSEESKEHIAIRDEMTTKDVVLPVIDETSPLKYIRSYEAGLFENIIPETKLLIAQKYPARINPEMDGGIDVFEEWEEDGQDTYDKWSVGTQVTPLYSYRSVGNIGGSTPTASYYNQVENGLIAYAGGVNVNYSPRKRLALQSGLYYSRMGLNVGNALYAKNAIAYASSSRDNKLVAVSNSSGTITTGDESGGNVPMFSDREQTDAVTSTADFNSIINFPTTGGEITQHFEYLELPVIVRFRVVDRKVGFNLLGGLSTNFLVGKDAYFQKYGDGEREFLGITGNLKRVNYSSVFGVGLDYAISSKLRLNFEPTFRYYLNSINTFSGLKSHPYSIGFYTGLSYSF